jgi:hypothetical protein
VKQAQMPALTLWRRLWFSGRLPQLEILLNKIAELQEKDRWWRNGKVPLLVNWLRDARWNDAPVPLASGAGVDTGAGLSRPHGRLQDGRSLMERNLATVARVLEQRGRENGCSAF